MHKTSILRAKKKTILDIINTTFNDNHALRKKAVDPDEKIKVLEGLISLTTDFNEQLKELGYSIDKPLTGKDLETYQELRNAALGHFFTLAHKQRSVAPLLEYARIFPVARITSHAASISTKLFDNYLSMWEDLALHIGGDKKISEETNLERLAGLVILGAISPNAQINLQVPGVALKRIIELSDFESGLALLKTQFSMLPGYILSDATELLIEEKAQSHKDFIAIEDWLANRYLTKVDGDELLGRLAIGDSLLLPTAERLHLREYERTSFQTTQYGLHAEDLLSALLSTSETPDLLQEYLYLRWWAQHRLGQTPNNVDLQHYFKIEDIAVWDHPGKEARLKLWVNEVPDLRIFKPVSDTFNEVFLVDNVVKYFLLRKLLIDPHTGVLLKEGGPKRFISSFMDAWVDTQDSKSAESLIKGILDGMTTANDPNELYHHINRILLGLVLLRPQQETDWTNIARTNAVKELRRLKESDTIDEITASNLGSLIAKLQNLITGGDRDSNSAVNGETLLLELAHKPTTNSIKTFSPYGLAHAAGTNLGSLGVRILQLAGQYFEIPESEKHLFEDVYDNMKGQSRLQAYQTLRRETKHSAELKQFFDDIVHFGSRIGGGSLMTVYEVTLNDGSKEAIAIKNPNIEFNLDDITSFIKRSLEAIPDNDQATSIQFIRALTDDAKQWILDELHDPRAEIKDLEFKHINDTTIPKPLFNQAGSRYHLLVPSSTPTNTTWIRRDTFIEGANLNGLKPVKGATDLPNKRINEEDLKDAVSLIVRNYIYQLTTTGLVHSDVHPGNFRISADNSAVAVLDRRNLLALSDSEKKLFRDMIKKSASGAPMSDVLDDIVSFIFVLEENHEIADILPKITQELSALTNEKQADTGTMIMKCVQTLKANNVYIPLPISLIIKNIYGLSEMAKKAGFENLGEAFMMSADFNDLARLA